MQPRFENDVPFFPPGRWDLARWCGMDNVGEATAMDQEINSDLEITTELPSGVPAAVLRGESELAEVVVLGAKGAGGLGNLVLGSVSLQVVAHSASTVVVANHIAPIQHRIVVGADALPSSTEVVEYAFREASVRGERVQALRAWNMPDPQEPPALIDSTTEDVTAAHLNALRGRLGRRCVDAGTMITRG